MQKAFIEKDQNDSPHEEAKLTGRGPNILCLAISAGFQRVKESLRL